MAKQESLLSKIEEWVREGLISPEEAEAISAYEALAKRRRVSPREIFLYVGGFFVLMAVGFGLQVLWADIRWLGRVVVVAVPTLILWAAGEALRRREEPLLKRGAQALWMVAAWLIVMLIWVTLNGWPGLDLKDEWLTLWGSLGALPLAVIALLVLPGLPQGLAVGTLVSGVAAGITMVVDDAWGEVPWALYSPWLVAGAMALVAAEVAHRRKKGSLIWLFNLFAAGSCLVGADIVTTTGRLPAWETYLPWLVGAAVGLGTAELAHRRKEPSLIWLFNLFGAGSCLIGALIIISIAERGNIYVMDADGSNQTRLTHNSGGACSPAWSPDGRTIAFESHRDRDREIYVMDADGSNQTRLTHNSGGACSPAWSPDGGRIAFGSWREGNEDIYVMDADGSNQTNLTQDSAEGWSPAWSPDGRRIAFESWREGNQDEDNQDIYVMDADGSNETRLTRNPARDWCPAWSPDGGRIAFASNRDKNDEIYVMDADGSSQTRLTRNPARDWCPGWSPDGGRIAFVSNRDKNDEIYVMDADGSNQTRLTENSAPDCCPAWSPDGGRIAFVSNRDKNEEIYVMDADGSNQTRLTHNWAVDRSPAWSPDGGRIAFESHRDRGTLPVWQALLLIESLALITWSVARQSRALLYSGALFLFVGIVQVSFEYFSGQLGLPVVLLIVGVALIAIGLGVDRLRRRLEAGT